MQEHCKRLGVVFREAQVREIIDEGAYKKIVLEDGDVLETKTVIAATGAVIKLSGFRGKKSLRAWAFRIVQPATEHFLRIK